MSVTVINSFKRPGVWEVGQSQTHPDDTGRPPPTVINFSGPGVGFPDPDLEKERNAEIVDTNGSRSVKFSVGDPDLSLTDTPVEVSTTTVINSLTNDRERKSGCEPIKVSVGDPDLPEGVPVKEVVPVDTFQGKNL